MWKHRISDDRHELVSLHDCTPDRIRLNKDTLIFSFSDGFWLSEKAPQNSGGTWVHTNAAEVRFYGFDPEAMQIRIFRHRWLLGWRIRPTLKELSLGQLRKMMARGRWEFEIIDEYWNDCKSMLCGSMHGKRGGIRTFQISFEYTDAEFCWNELCPDRQW